MFCLINLEFFVLITEKNLPQVRLICFHNDLVALMSAEAFETTDSIPFWYLQRLVQRGYLIAFFYSCSYRK